MENDVKVLEEMTEVVDTTKVEKTSKSALGCMVLAAFGAYYIGSKIFGFTKAQISKANAKKACNESDDSVEAEIIDFETIDSEE